MIISRSLTTMSETVSITSSFVLVEVWKPYLCRSPVVMLSFHIEPASHWSPRRCAQSYSHR